MLTAGQASDLAGFDGLAAKIKSDTLIGDKGYDADERVRVVLQAAGKTAVIPPRSNRKSPANYDKELYKKRHKIENFFGRLKDFRGIAYCHTLREDVTKLSGRRASRRSDDMACLTIENTA